MERNKIFLHRRGSSAGFWADRKEYESQYAEKTNDAEYPHLASGVDEVKGKMKNLITSAKDGGDIKPSYISNLMRSIDTQLGLVNEAIIKDGENAQLKEYKSELTKLKNQIKKGKFE